MLGFLWVEVWLLVLPKFADELAALFDSLVKGCGGSCDFVEGCTCGNGVVWFIWQRLWLCFSASPKVADVTAALFDGDTSYECFNKNIWIQNILIKLIISISYHIEKRNEWISCLCTLLGRVFSTETCEWNLCKYNNNLTRMVQNSTKKWPKSLKETDQIDQKMTRWRPSELQHSIP